MKKQEFLTALWKQLSDMPNSDVERSLDYYSEMIDDRVEAGMSEEEAVAEIGSVEEAAKQIFVLPREIRYTDGVSTNIYQGEGDRHPESRRPVSRPCESYTEAVCLASQDGAVLNRLKTR